MLGSRKKVFMSFTIIVLAALFIFIAFYAGKNYAFHKMNILYVSQAELLDIEKSRIKNLSVGDKQLFFGKPEEAIKYIDSIVNQQFRSNKIILLTDGKIYGTKVKSISKEIHKSLIDRLSKENR